MAPLEPSVGLVIMLILTSAWAWGEESSKLPPDTPQTHGKTLSRRSLNYPLGKEKEPECDIGEYLHPNKTHCCMRCHAGTYLVGHCRSRKEVPDCKVCPNGTYTDVHNTVPKCFRCSQCGPKNQITVSECTAKRNTVCGCRDKEYLSGPSCRKCSSCPNGTIVQQCEKDRDSICHCHNGFFLERNNCYPCNSCNTETCRESCEKAIRVHTVVSPEADLIICLISLVVAFGIGIPLLLLAVKWIRRIRKDGPSHIFYSCVSVQQPTKEQIPEAMNNKIKTAVFPVEYTQKETLTVTAVEMPVSKATDSQELPDCVGPAGKAQLPNNPDVLYTVVDHVPPFRWKEFVRRLGLSDYEIEQIEMEQRRVRDAHYEMLKQWRLKKGRGATVECISCVLNQMELSGCSEAIQEALPRRP
ncbi:tumor necrosis factor receptor superfamily member 1A isoform X1 [Alligator mississippiensis]|uniref:Tumor necrosis factor receptor superfamily member 1A n=1 Tax=Alligator mississippiensis TaxID=8496 RepID=A0A151MD86_ALLMI|nr:tumor necrosis factor receptor superfamily member 1A isoform X1 [Alligator mississippiensis]KYO22453.1 tumor necrosis factor receptor superfamily member 1A [Alligator mississippiensis]